MGHLIRRIVFPLVAITTSGLLLTITIFAGEDASLRSMQISTFKGTSTAAVACSVIALMSVITLSTSQILLIRTYWLNHGLFPLTGALVSLAAAILTLDVVILKRMNPTYFSQSKSISTTARIIVWTFTSFFQLVFYTLFVFLRQPTADHLIERRRTPAPLSSLKDKKLVPSRPKTPPTPLRMVAPPFALPQASTPLPPQLPSTPKRNSWRDSFSQLQHVVRPTVSKKRLLSNGQSHTARSSMSRDSQFSETKSIAGNSDSFAEWWEHSTLNNSSPETAIRDLLASPGYSSNTPSRLASGVLSTPLEPIPDSRPVSPARTIDVIENMVPDSPSDISSDSTSKMYTPPPRSLERPTTSYSSTSIAATIANSTPSTISRPPTAYSNQSRRMPSSPRSTTPSVTGSGGTEAHIHPLFRTDSPTPPPGTSPGTVVVASPFSGTMLPRSISPRPSFHRQQRMSEHGSMRAPSRSGSRMGSSMRVGEDGTVSGGGGVGSPLADGSMSQSDEGPWESGLPAENSERMTPNTVAVGSAIPHFVLSASKERII